MGGPIREAPSPEALEAPVRAALRTIPLFARVDAESLRALAAAGKTVELGPGEAVVREGDPAYGLYSVLSGALRVSARGAGGAEVELRRLGAGESFGELALLDGGTRSASVETLTPCRLFTLERVAFLAALPRSPALLAAVLAGLTEAVRTSSQRVVREELEQRTLRAEMELERYRALTQLVAGVAHEINTPLGIVSTAASVVGRRASAAALIEAAGDPEARASLEDLRAAAALIEANVRRAHALIQSFKQLSVSQLVDTPETLSLPDTVEEIVGLFRIEARRAGLEIRVRNALPDGAAGTWVGHRGYLSQVLLNLLTNVERYAYPEGAGGAVEIEVAEAGDGKEDAFAVTVRDFGRGIAPDALPRVFEPFFTTGRGRGGTGLGMAIVHNVVTSALKGRVELTSEPGRGTAVTVTVPKTVP
jgi:signal transduction histidine kinase